MTEVPFSLVELPKVYRLPLNNSSIQSFLSI